MKKLLLAGLAILILTTPSAQARSPRAAPGKRVVLIVANGLSAQDLVEADLPGIRQSLTRNAAIGLMNVRAARGASDLASAYLSIGAGARTDAGATGNLALDKGERFFMAGRPEKPWPVGTGSVISPSYPEMARLAGKLPYPARPGALGAALKQGGISAAVYGNADSLGVYHREINLITMDGRGITRAGSVAKPIDSAAGALNLIDGDTPRGGFTAIEFSLFSNIGLNRNFIRDKQVAARKTHALAELDALFTSLARAGSERGDTLTILVSPFPDPALAKGGLTQTPVLVAGPGYRGLLSSPDTRWRGIVTSANIAPTVLRFLGVDPPAVIVGRPLLSFPAADPLANIDTINDRAATNYGARSILLSTYITLVVATLVSTALALLLWPRSNGTRFLRPLLLTVLYFPAAALLANAFVSKIAWLPLALVPALTIGLALLTWLGGRGRPLSALASPSLLATVVIVAQLAFGSVLERNSIMGMSSIVGARFYGIGNEYMGVLIAAFVVSFAALAGPRTSLKEKPIVLIPALFIPVVVIVALPGLGANVGGALTAIVTSVVGFRLLRGDKLKLRHLAYIGAAMAVVVGGILLVDSLSASLSHAGRAAAAIGSGGPKEALAIVARKVAVNFMLITRSSWTNIILAAFFAATVLKLGAARSLTETEKGYPLMVAACKTIVGGSLAAFLLNDSGVVTAALMVTFAACSWLYLLLDETSPHGSLSCHSRASGNPVPPHPNPLPPGERG